MARLVLVFLLIVTVSKLVAQDKSDGKITDLTKNITKNISYTKTPSETPAEYATSYDIRDSNDELIYMITASHPKTDSEIVIITSRDGINQYRTIGFNRHECGLIINSDNILDTAFTESDKKYNLLISFQDTEYTYPSVNRITTTSYKDYVELDQISSLLIKKHKQKIASMKPQVDSTEYYRARAEAIEQERKLKEQQERTKQEEEKKKAEAEKEKVLAEAQQAENRRNIYYKKYASTLSEMKYQDRAEEIGDSDIDRYLSEGECYDIKVNTGLLIYIDTVGKVITTVPTEEWSEGNANIRHKDLIVLKEIGKRIQSLKLPVTTVNIEGQAFPVNAKWVYKLKFESHLHIEKYHFDDSNILRNKENEEVKGATRDQFFQMHGNKFTSNKFKVKFCSHTVGAHSHDSMIEIIDTEAGPDGVRHVIYRYMKPGNN